MSVYPLGNIVVGIMPVCRNAAWSHQSFPSFRNPCPHVGCHPASNNLVFEPGLYCNLLNEMHGCRHIVGSEMH
jgi:hypothetical protein